MKSTHIILAKAFIFIIFSFIISFSTSAQDFMCKDCIEDTIPDFAANPNIRSIKNGNWSDPTVWSLGRIPMSEDTVLIDMDTEVKYDIQSDARIKTLQVQHHGSFIFRTDINTKLMVGTLVIAHMAYMEIGNESQPVNENVKAEIIILDQSLDLTSDPRQYGNGIIGMGKVVMHGFKKEETFIRLAAEPKKGNTSITLSASAKHWKVGDEIVIPDTHHQDWWERINNSGGYIPQWEDLSITAISADSMTLAISDALKFDHIGARNENNVLEFLPHVANLSRNIIIRSENPNGVRGHTLFTHRAEVDIRYVSFFELGRTKLDAEDNSIFDTQGKLLHLGINQKGRYPLHFHHLMGPEAIPANGYQFTIIGNAVNSKIIDNPFIWAITLHNSHYGLIHDNVVCNSGGAGLVGEDGSESFNMIDHNFITRVNGTGGRLDGGRDGIGFWFHGFNNYVRNNIATNIGAKGIYCYGFNFFGYYVGHKNIPAYQGSDLMTAGGTIDVDMNNTPILEFKDNEVYGATPNGLTFWWLNNNLSGVPYANVKETTIKNLRVWHVHSWGVFHYPHANVIMDGFTYRGDRNIFASNNGSLGLYYGDYDTKDNLIINADIQGAQTGIETPANTTGVITIKNSYIEAGIAISCQVIWSVAADCRRLGPRKVIIDNVKFNPNNWINISKPFGGKALVQKNEVYVYNYNGNPEENFKLFSYEQDKDSLTSQKAFYNGDTNYVNITGITEPGLTNAKAWAKYGMANWGEIMPDNAEKKDKILGMVVPLTITKITENIKSAKGILVSPNPFNATVKITVIDVNEAGASIQVIDMKGIQRQSLRVNYSELQSGYTADLSTLPAGIYLIRVVGNTLGITKTITVVKTE